MASLEEAAEVSTTPDEVGVWATALSNSLASVKANIPEGVRLVAVSKTKPAEALIGAYREGQRIFGENYVQELCEKATNPELASLPIAYHFIGHLQSNKVGALIRGVPQLDVVETVESLKLATKLSNAVQTAVAEGLRPSETLKVMIQVNSSGEPQKGGVESVEEAVLLAEHIVLKCPCLVFIGLMTIGNADYTAGPSNFTFLAGCRQAVATALSLEEASLELSMGMSGDYQTAITHGSTNVRVGSTIFGGRTYSK